MARNEEEFAALEQRVDAVIAERDNALQQLREAQAAAAGQPADGNANAAGQAAAAAGQAAQAAAVAAHGHAQLLQRIQVLEAAAAAAQGGGQNARRRDHKFRTFSNPSTEDWTILRRHYENTAALNGFTDREAKLALSAAMEKDAALAVRDIPVEDNLVTFAQQLDRYEARFVPAAASELAKAQFESIKQRRDENALVYTCRGRALYHKAYPNAADEELLIRTLIHGMLNKTIRTQTMRSRPETMDALLECMQNEAAVVNMTAYLDGGKQPSQVPMEIGAMQKFNAAPGAAGAARQGPAVQAASPARPQDKPKKKLKCFYCGNWGHIKAECKKLIADAQKGNPRAIAALQVPDDIEVKLASVEQNARQPDESSSTGPGQAELPGPSADATSTGFQPSPSA